MKNEKPMRDFIVIISPKSGYGEAYATFVAVIEAKSKAEVKRMAERRFETMYEYKKPLVFELSRNHFYRE